MGSEFGEHGCRRSKGRQKLRRERQRHGVERSKTSGSVCIAQCGEGSEGLSASHGQGNAVGVSESSECGERKRSVREGLVEREQRQEGTLREAPALLGQKIGADNWEVSFSALLESAESSNVSVEAHIADRYRGQTRRTLSDRGQWIKLYGCCLSVVRCCKTLSHWRR